MKPMSKKNKRNASSTLIISNKIPSNPRLTEITESLAFLHRSKIRSEAERIVGASKTRSIQNCDVDFLDR
jgi:hypothetical protein